MIDTPYVHSMSFEKAVEAKPLVHDTDTLFDMRIIRMRQIKFRHYDKRLNNFLIFELLPVGIARDETIVSFDKDRLDSPIEQYTGLKDKKGNDIYEDDICTVAGMGLAIVDICPYNGTQFKTLDGYDVPVIDCVAEDDDFEIVGNIHQNPELLDGDK